MKNDEEIAAKTGGRQMGPVAQNGEGANAGANSGSSTGSNSGSGGSDNSQRQMMQPPEMDCDSADETCEAPEPPEGFDGEMPSGMGEGMQGKMGGMRGEFMGQDASSNPDAILHPAGYLAIGGCSVVVGILVSYACFSRFFHLRPGDTFNKSSKFIWFVVVALVIAVGLSVLGFFIPKWVQG